MKKLIAWLVVLVVLAGAGYGIWRYQKARSVPELAWKTAPVEKRKISAKVTASGTGTLNQYIERRFDAHPSFDHFRPNYLNDGYHY